MAKEMLYKKIALAIALIGVACLPAIYARNGWGGVGIASIGIVWSIGVYMLEVCKNDK